MAEELEEILKKFSLSSKKATVADLGEDDVKTVISNYRRSLIEKIVGEKNANFVGVKNFGNQAQEEVEDSSRIGGGKNRPYPSLDQSGLLEGQIVQASQKILDDSSLSGRIVKKSQDSLNSSQLSKGIEEDRGYGQDNKLPTVFHDQQEMQEDQGDKDLSGQQSKVKSLSPEMECLRTTMENIDKTQKDEHQQISGLKTESSGKQSRENSKQFKSRIDYL
ncbi:hypothetical protein ACH5RR_015598 [Cinchona calisaya]|uniref:Uncharacterized protein n=1 Tax=Cinchona calisaya TaxID=153742 RepID=A0ABD2ZTN3_9GENT